MAEKVLHEVRIVETDDGFRIEIKGDKERIKEFLKHRGFGAGMHGFGPMGFMSRRHHRRHHGHGPWGQFARFWGGGPWGWDDEEEEREEASRRGPAADRGPEPRV